MLVRGTATHVRDPARIAALADTAVHPWAPGPRDRWIEIHAAADHRADHQASPGLWRGRAKCGAQLSVPQVDRKDLTCHVGLLVSGSDALSKCSANQRWKPTPEGERNAGQALSGILVLLLPGLRRLRRYERRWLRRDIAIPAFAVDGTEVVLLALARAPLTNGGPSAAELRRHPDGSRRARRPPPSVLRQAARPLQARRACRSTLPRFTPTGRVGGASLVSAASRNLPAQLTNVAKLDVRSYRRISSRCCSRPPSFSRSLPVGPQLASRCLSSRCSMGCSSSSGAAGRAWRGTAARPAPHASLLGDGASTPCDDRCQELSASTSVSVRRGRAAGRSTAAPAATGPGRARAAGASRSRP